MDVGELGGQRVQLVAAVLARCELWFGSSSRGGPAEVDLEAEKDDGTAVVPPAQSPAVRRGKVPKTKAKAKPKAKTLCMEDCPLDKLTCGKCGEDTAIIGSYQSGGRNPWRRICHCCANTERWLQRQFEILKSDEAKTSAASSNAGAADSPQKKATYP